MNRKTEIRVVARLTGWSNQKALEWLRIHSAEARDYAAEAGSSRNEAIRAMLEAEREVDEECEPSRKSSCGS